MDQYSGILRFIRIKQFRIILSLPTFIIHFRLSRSIVQSTVKNMSKKQETEDLDKPLSYLNSEAASFTARNSFRGRKDDDDSPWYQSLSISLSIGAILLWFCVLREENDVDQKLGISLFDRVPGLEKKQLELLLEHSRQEDKDSIKKRLDELSNNS